MPAERVAVVGAGAVGCYFGGMLARAGVPVTLIGRADHGNAINRDGLFLERADSQGYIKVAAETRIEAVREATIVLLCVKTIDTETAAVSIAPHLANVRCSSAFRMASIMPIAFMRQPGSMRYPRLSMLPPQ
jgi:ketopantoate reductase